MNVRNLVFAALFTALNSVAVAQKIVPQIKQGTVLDYTTTYNSQNYPYNLVFTALADSIKMTWSVDGYGTGVYAMSRKSLETGSAFFASIPRPEMVNQLSEKESVGFISKAAFAELLKNKKVQYNGETYNLDKSTHAPIVISGKELDVVYAVSAESKHLVGILDNPAFPLIVLSNNAAKGADYVLNNIK